LEGLEAVEISYKEFVLSNNETFRFDSEYFQKYLLNHIAQLKKLSPQKLEDIAHVKGGKRLPLGDDFTELGIRYIRAEDVKNSFVQYKNSPFISEKTHSEIATYQTTKNDVLLTIVGNSIGDIGLVKFELDKCNLTENCVKVVSKSSEQPFFSDYLFLFFMSHYGQIQIQREKVGTAQPKLAIERIRRFLVPVASPVFQEILSGMLMEANSLLSQKDDIYTQAETLLLDTLGMADFLPDTETVNIKSFKDSFAATGRLDAEYYQPKYEQVMAHITAQSHDTLSALVTIKKSIEPGSDEYSDDEQGLPFMRVADYSKFGVTPPQKKIKASFVAENKDKLDALMPKAGTVLFSKDGSVGEAYCLREDANFITSGAVLHLTVRDTKKLLPDYLTLALNSKLVKMQAERDAGGSIILHWRVGEIESVVVPLADMPTQQKIAALVQQSFTLKAESEHLLVVAKRAVEMAIEQDEAAAMAYLAANA
jgi:type I restriction enzyme, S subunit